MAAPGPSHGHKMLVNVGHLVPKLRVMYAMMLAAWRTNTYDTIRYDFNVRSKANMSQLNLPHGTDN